MEGHRQISTRPSPFGLNAMICLRDSGNHHQQYYHTNIHSNPVSNYIKPNINISRYEIIHIPCSSRRCVGPSDLNEKWEFHWERHLFFHEFFVRPWSQNVAISVLLKKRRDTWEGWSPSARQIQETGSASSIRRSWAKFDRSDFKTELSISSVMPTLVSSLLETIEKSICKWWINTQVVFSFSAQTPSKYKTVWCHKLKA